VEVKEERKKEIEEVLDLVGRPVKKGYIDLAKKPTGAANLKV
jgi:hypothetical protein